MSHQTYAFLVGIDQYDHTSSVPPLQGCTNDVKAMQAYLEGRVSQDAGQLHLKTLLNEQATRQAVIDGFRNHLGQAGPDDVALFFYAGHGSQENAPEEFWHLEPDRLNETLVCYDSRCDGSWDLADKELAKLIAEVAANNPHIVVILDCCHSGSGTRGDLPATEAVRRAPVDKRQRPLSSFIVTPEEVSAAPPVTRSLTAPTSGWHIPQSRHVLLAACRDIEEAKEYPSNGEHRGAFSYFLLDALHKANGVLTYREVFQRASALVKGRVAAQSPQLEATFTEDLNQPFLGGAIQPRNPHFTASHSRTHGWVIDGGSIHGIPQPASGEATRLALYPFDLADALIMEGAPSVGLALVTAVMPGMSQIKIQGLDDLQPDMTFKAVIASLPLPPMGVLLSGETAGIDLLRQALANAQGLDQPSLFVREVTSPVDAKFQVLAVKNTYRIKRPADDRILVAPVQSFAPGSARQVIQQLEHMARWTATLELETSPTSHLEPNAIQMEIFHGGEVIGGDQIKLTYGPNDTKPTFRLKVTNVSQQPFYCTVLDLTETFKIASLFRGETVRLNPGEAAWMAAGRPVPLVIPEHLWQQGVTEYTDVFKLIASPMQFDGALLEQPALNTPRNVTTRGIPKTALGRLMNRVQTRDADLDSVDTATDWITSQVTLTVVRPKLTVAVSPASGADLGAGVQVLPHSAFQAQARLTTVNQSTRDLGSHILPPLLRDQTQPLQFTASRATDPGLSALELREVQNREAVTPENPLKVLADVPLEDGAYVLPVAYDGEFYLPLGRGIAKGNQTEITLEHLPEPISEGKRSLGGAIRIFFQKVVTKKLGPELSQKLGVSFDYPLLAIAEVNHGEVTYIVDPAIVAQQVAQAQRIALYIHGIIGDTQSMVPSIETAVAALEGEPKPLKDCYDLVLAFDYESINTSITAHARGLKQRLREAGLGPTHGKTLHVIAHSMGGLVSRWLIEQEGGNEVVQHLILLGTPSAGSPWPQVQAGLTVLMALVINSLSTVSLPIRILGSLLACIEAIDVTLDEMEPGSEFLQALAASDDPGIPYTVIAGNTSLINSAPDTVKGKLVARLKSLMQLPFFGVPNDLAVTVASIKAIPAKRTPAPVIQEVDCDHLVYFTDESGVKALGASIANILTAASVEGVPPADPPPSEQATAKPLPPSQASQPQYQMLWWVLGAIALIIIGFSGLYLSNQPQTSPNDVQSFSRSTAT